MRAVLCLLVCQLAGAAFKCGIDDPTLGHLFKMEADVQPQVYETPAMVAEARRLSGDHAHWGTPPLASARRELVESWDRALQSQAYTDTTSTFVPISIADAANATAPIRITIVWEVVDRGDAVFIDPSTNALSTMPRQCSTVGQVISVRSTAGWRSYTEGCKAANVVGGVVGDATLAQMKLRTATAKAYWQATLKVKPVQDKIKVSTAANNAITGDFGISAGREFLDSDLVIIMTARPSPDSPIAGFAICYQKDQRGRCTIGQFNWVPEIINPSKGLSADTIEAEMHTALHEMVHVLGGMSPGSNGDASVFLGPTGAPMQGSDVFITEEDPAFSEAIAVAQSQGRVAAKKYRTMIATPKVRATARKWLGCNNISGFPLEDVPLGKGSHWEARVGGPELMSYGAGSGQTYISDLTLGFLDDTNQYVVNYAMGGQLPGVMTTDESAALFSAQAGSQLEPASSLSPGALRWGQFEGCGFINSPPRVSWPEEYLCQTKNTYTCTPDHRMSAVCMMSTWTTVPSNPSCGRFVQYNSTFQPPATGPLCEVTNDSPVLNGIPSYMQFYPDDAAAATAMGAGATAARSGGINDAMDFAPVPVGYWNCMYATPSDNSTTSSASEYGALKSIVESFGKAADMNEFGGQARSPQSRCFVSSLMELTRVATLNPTFPKYGLCYRANCYKKDYLQVGVLSAVRRTAQWYQCPAAGGKLYIPGFTGSLHCPVAEDFCSHETITGFKYAEVSIIAQAIFWGLALAALLFFFGFALLPCMRERVITCSKRCCAVRVLEDDVAKRLRALGKGTFEAEALEMELGEPAPLPVTATRILLSINLITLLLGLAITGFTIYMLVLAKVYSFSFSLLGVGFMISMVSVLGVQAARSRAEHQPSCWVLTYFVCDLGVSILLLWTVAYNLAFPSYKYYVTEYWDVISSALPASLTAGLNQTAAIDVVTAKLTSNFTAISGMGAAVLVLLLITLAAAGVIITAKVLNTISLTIMNYALLIGGVVMTAVGWFLYAYNTDLAGTAKMTGLIISSGMLFMLVSSLGLAAVFRRSATLTLLYMATCLVVVAVSAACAFACFERSEEVVAFIAGQDDKKLGAIASALGLALTSSSIVETLQANIHQLGLAFAVILVLQVWIIFNCCTFLFALRTWHSEQGLTLWGVALPEGSVEKPRKPVVLGGHGPSSERGSGDSARQPPPRVAAAEAAVVMVDNRMPRPRAPPPAGPPKVAGPRILG